MSDTTTPPEEPTLASILDHIRALDERLDDMHADQVDANAAADDVPVEYDGMPMSETLRDVVNSQLLALARAETEEAVHASVNAIHEVLHRDDPPEPDVFDRLETLLSRPEVQPLVALVIGKILSSIPMAPPEAPKAADTAPASTPTAEEPGHE